MSGSTIAKDVTNQKESLLDIVRAIYGPHHLDNYGFEILPCRHRDSGYKKIVLRAIVYTAPNYAQWKLLLVSGHPETYTRNAYDAFAKELEIQMGAVTEPLTVGDTCAGGPGPGKKYLS